MLPPRESTFQFFLDFSEHIFRNLKSKNWTYILALTFTLAGGLCEDHKREIDFLRNCVAESTAYFFIIIFKLIFTPVIEIETFEKTILGFERIFILEGRFSNFHTLRRIDLIVFFFTNLVTNLMIRFLSNIKIFIF